MSFNAVVELVLHLENYYILEYPHQGLFSFHCSIFQLKEGQPVIILSLSFMQYPIKYCLICSKKYKNYQPESS